MEPFLGGVGAAALAAGADGNSRQSQRERDVGVGGRTIDMRPDSEVRVHGPDEVQDGSVVGKAAAGTRSDLFDFACNPASGGAVVLRFQRSLDRGGEQCRKLVNFDRAFGAYIDLRASLAGD